MKTPYLRLCPQCQCEITYARLWNRNNAEANKAKCGKCRGKLKPTPIDKRFWQYVNKTGDCWLWIGAKKATGYGYTSLSGKGVRAHRASWEIHRGPIPDGLCVLHKCDNPPCVNPDHLFLGTQQDNMTDKYNKGRQNIPSGQAHYNCKLSISDRQFIKEYPRTHMKDGSGAKLAKMFGVAPSVISTIRNEKD
jgi:hypothetical protein